MGRPAVFLLLLTLLLPVRLPAADIVWTNVLGGAWNTAVNWSPAKVPTATDTAWITTPGTYSVNLTAATSVSNVVVGGAAGVQTVNFASTVTSAGSLVIQGNGVLRLSTGSQLAGSGSLTNHGRLEWVGGTINRPGPLLNATDGLLWINGPTLAFTGSTLVNQGQCVWGGGTVACSAQGTSFSNEPGALVLVTNTIAWNTAGASAVRRIANEGTLRVNTPAAGTVTLQLALESAGSLELISGRLSLRGGTLDGSLNIGAGSVLEFEAATNHLNPGLTLSQDPDGAIELTAGMLDASAAGPLSIERLTLSGGTLADAADLTVTRQLSWTGGTLDNARVQSTGELLLTGAAHSFNDSTLENAGHATWSGATLTTAGGTTSVFTNRPGATLEVTNTATWNVTGTGAACRLANAGTIRRNGGGVAWTLQAEVENYGSVECEKGSITIPAPHQLVQYDGVLHLAGGGLNAGSPIDLRGGQLTGAGTVTGSVTNGATVKPGDPTGLLTISADYIQTAAGRLEIELGGTVAGTTHDRLAVGDQAFLAGTVAASLVNGFVPDPTNRLGFLTCHSRSNSFDALTTSFPLPPASLFHSNTVVYIGFRSTDWTLAPIADPQQIAESNKLTLTVKSSAPMPLFQALTFDLLTGPAGMVLNPTNGLLTWTPTEAQGPGQYPVSIRVVDNAPSPREQSLSLTVAVSEVNLPPAIATIPSSTIDEEVPFTLQIPGSDPDLPANTLTYSLLSGPPGMQVSPSGLLTWTPEEEQGPGSYKVTVGVVDDGSPSRSTNRTFTLTVREVNSPPTLVDPGDQVVVEGDSLSFSLDATDPDFPANAIFFQLLSAPPGVSVTGDGTFTWRANAAKAPSTNEVRVRVFDNGLPQAASTQSFNVVVVSPQAPSLRIRPSPTAGIVVDWPTTPSGFRLQSAPSLDPGAGWTDVGGSAVNLGAEWEQSLPATDTQRYFRLAKDGSTPTPATASLARGPYLQMRTTNGVLVRFKTNRLIAGRIRYGLDPAQLLLHADGPVTNHHAIALSGLAPNTRYYYSVGSDVDTIASGPSYFFQTAPQDAQPTRIWVVGDSGTASPSAASVRNAYQKFAGDRYTDLFLMLGDNAYQTGTEAEYQVAVFNMYAPILRQTALWPTIGNHDTAQLHEPVATTPYLSLFTLPTAGEAGGVPSGTERYYSFNHGNIHFVCLDSMTSERTDTGAMATWLRADLEANTNTWLIAFWHHPPYSRGSHDSDNPDGTDFELSEMRANLVPILESYGVDLVLNGHSHSYERSYLLHNHYGDSTTLTPDMILDAGSGGSADQPYVKHVGNTGEETGTVYTVAGSSGQVSVGPLNHPAMRVGLLRLGSLVIDVNGTMLEARFLRETGEVLDHFYIRKP